jgi:NADPH-dependent 2,4-dienoyl-CoA reductase/sulfur reductase-like enzyme
MSKKVLIIGGVAGGASVASRIRRLDEFAEIIMFERGPHVSFSNCSLPYHLSGIVPNWEDLVLMSPENFLDVTKSKHVCPMKSFKSTVRSKQSR